MNIKLCIKCKEEKDISLFSKNKNHKDGLLKYCKLCKKEIDFLRRDKIKEYSIVYNSLPEIKLKKKESNKVNYIKNKEKIQRYNKEWRNNNLDKVKDYYKKYSKEKYCGDIKYKISEVIRSRFWSAIKNNSKKSSVIKLLGCSIEEFKLYIESKFLPEMNWDNWGEIWELDHVIPCSSFDMEFLSEQQKCFHFSNYQPLFKTTQIAESFGYMNQIGNRNKSNK